MEGEWVTLYAPICFLTNSAVRVLPGDSAIVATNVVGYTDANTYPRLDPRMVAGTYRLLFAVTLAEPSMGVTSAADLYRLPSQTFTVND
jgi:hypothetical protein